MWYVIAIIVKRSSLLQRSCHVYRASGVFPVFHRIFNEYAVIRRMKPSERIIMLFLDYRKFIIFNKNYCETASLREFSGVSARSSGRQHFALILPAALSCRECHISFRNLHEEKIDSCLCIVYGNKRLRRHPCVYNISVVLDEVLA